MSRAACALLLLLPVARADDPDAVKKLIPKDQQEAMDKIVALGDLNRQANEEKNGLKKKELHDKLQAEQRAFVAALTKKLRADGLKDWVGKCDGVGSATATFHVPGAHLPELTIAVTIGNAADKTKDVLRSLDKGDYVQFTVAPGPRLGVRLRSEKDVMPDMGITTDGKGLKELKKLDAK